MKTAEKIGALGLVLVAVGGGFAFGSLKGQIDGLGPERIRAAQEETFKELGETMSEFRASLRFPSATDAGTWRQGDKPVELIPIAEGICYLVEVAGRFEGDGEVVRVVGRGQHWYLEGLSNQVGVRAKAACWRFPTVGASE